MTEMLLLLTTHFACWRHLFLFSDDGVHTELVKHCSRRFFCEGISEHRQVHQRAKWEGPPWMWAGTNQWDEETLFRWFCQSRCGFRSCCWHYPTASALMFLSLWSPGLGSSTLQLQTEDCPITSLLLKLPAKKCHREKKQLYAITLR